MHHGDDLVEHRTREVCFGAQCTNHSANSMCVIRIYFDVTEIAIQRIAKHLNTTLDSPQLRRAVKLSARKRAALYVRTL